VGHGRNRHPRRLGDIGNRHTCDHGLRLATLARFLDSAGTGDHTRATNAKAIWHHVRGSR
jgi:hypothetical protein